MEGPPLCDFSSVEAWWSNYKTVCRPNQRSRQQHSSRNAGASTSTDQEPEREDETFALTEWDAWFHSGSDTDSSDELDSSRIKLILCMTESSVLIVLVFMCELQFIVVVFCVLITTCIGQK